MSSRVVSVRFSEAEYEALLGLGVLEDETINGLIRKATGEYLRRAVESPDYDNKKQQAIQRAVDADRMLRESVGIENAEPIFSGPRRAPKKPTSDE
jgi:hypothetical protein